MLIPFLLSLASPAWAAAELEVKTYGPVVVYVDGEKAQLTGKLTQRIGGLEPGDHAITITGVFGKTLFEGDITVPDGTITQATWANGRLEVNSTDWLDGPLDPPEEEEPQVADDQSEPPLEVAAADGPTEEVLALPAGGTVEPPPSLEAPPQDAVALPRPVAAGRTLTVQASEGMRVEVVHEGASVLVVLKDGVFHIEDPAGLKLALSAH